MKLAKERQHEGQKEGGKRHASPPTGGKAKDDHSSRAAARVAKQVGVSTRTMP